MLQGFAWNHSSSFISSLSLLSSLSHLWKSKLLSRVWLFVTHGLYSPWNSPGQNTGVGSLSLLQGNLPNPGIKLRSPALWQILYQLSHQGSPRILEWVAYPFSSGSSQPRNRTRVSCIAGGLVTNWAIGKPPISEATWKLWCEKLSLMELRNHLSSHHRDQTQESARLGQLLSSCFSAPNPLYSDAGRLWKPHFCFANCSLRVSARGRQSPEEWGGSKAHNFLSASRLWEHHPRLTTPS